LGLATPHRPEVPQVLGSVILRGHVTVDVVIPIRAGDGVGVPRGDDPELVGLDAELFLDHQPHPGSAAWAVEIVADSIKTYAGELAKNRFEPEKCDHDGFCGRKEARDYRSNS
jgi:hypothetical protein